MGECESKNNENNIMPNIFIEKGKKDDIKNDKKIEAVIPGNANYNISNDKLNIIMNQKTKSICKIIKKGKLLELDFYVLLLENIKKEQL